MNRSCCSSLSSTSAPSVRSHSRLTRLAVHPIQHGGASDDRSPCPAAGRPEPARTDSSRAASRARRTRICAPRGRTLAQRKRGHLKGNGPPFGALHEPGDVFSASGAAAALRMASASSRLNRRSLMPISRNSSSAASTALPSFGQSREATTKCNGRWHEADQAAQKVADAIALSAMEVIQDHHRFARVLRQSD